MIRDNNCGHPHEEGMGPHGKMGPMFLMWMHHLPSKQKKAIKLAMLEKKEKMLKAKLEFIEKMKGIVEEWDPKEEKEM